MHHRLLGQTLKRLNSNAPSPAPRADEKEYGLAFLGRGCGLDTKLALLSDLKLDMGSCPHPAYALLSSAPRLPESVAVALQRPLRRAPRLEVSRVIRSRRSRAAGGKLPPSIRVVESEVVDPDMTHGTPDSRGRLTFATDAACSLGVTSLPAQSIAERRVVDLTPASMLETPRRHGRCGAEVSDTGTGANGVRDVTTKSDVVHLNDELRVTLVFR